MLKIRTEHEEAFQQEAWRKFEDEMIEHLKDFAPELSQILKEAGVRRVVRLGVKRAGQYGLEDRTPLRFYIELMFTFGSFFDADVQLPWARQILSNSGITDQYRRVDRLYTKVADYLAHVAGPKNEYAVRALQRACQFEIENSPRVISDFENQTLAGLGAIYPEKCAYVGEHALRLLITDGIETANSCGVHTERGAAILVGVMFGFGAGVTADPLYPWVSATLHDELVPDPNDRLERLRTKARIYAERVSAKLGS